MFLRLLIILIIVAVAAAVFYGLNPADDSQSPLLRGLAEIQSQHAAATPPKPATTVYKWQDKSGQWHFSNQPPPPGTASSVKTYRADSNIMQAPPAAADATPADDPSDTALLPLTDPSRIKQLIHDAKNVQNLMDQRQQQLDDNVEH
jgi:hypothetical protein